MMLNLICIPAMMLLNGFGDKRNTGMRSMRMFMLFMFFSPVKLLAADTTTITPAERMNEPVKPRRINLIISPRVRKFDPGTMSFQVQAFIQRAVLRKETRLIVVGSSEEMYYKIR